MKTKGNMYDWVEMTWNPLAGKCPHDCSYCSTKSLRWPEVIEKYTGEPRLDEAAMKKNLGKGKTIFVCSQNDLFADEISSQIIMDILRYCGEFDNTYVFQTKNPAKYWDFKFSLPEKSILCTTIESDLWYSKIMGNTIHTAGRSDAMSIISGFGFITYVTIEPILDFNLMNMVQLIENCNPAQVNIGADSKRHNLPEPPKEKILALINELEKFTVVKQKDNLKRLLK